MILERLTQKIHPGCWAALEELNKKYDAVEQKHGYPPKRRYQLVLGAGSLDTLVVERDWESMAEWEKHLTEVMQDPDHQKLGEEAIGIIESSQMEALIRLP